MSKPASSEKNLALHLISGGFAGFSEAVTCHPLDTIKVRLQLRGKQPNQNFIAVGRQIWAKEGFLALYKGLGAVVMGIVPKQSIRFASFDFFKSKIGTDSGSIFIAGLLAGTTESVMVVSPMDVIKIRLQAQRHSMTDPLDVPKYRNAAHCAYVMVMEEGFTSLYKGVTLTIIRQGTNQAANFTAYQFMKKKLQERQNGIEVLPSYQTLIMGIISGACGPLFNAPVDTVKTRIQKTPSTEGDMTRIFKITKDIYVNEGFRAFYKGLTPRVLRVAPGQGITFMVYERVYSWLSNMNNDVSEAIEVTESD